MYSEYLILSPSIEPTFGSFPENPISVFKESTKASRANAMTTVSTMPKRVRKVFKLAI